MEPTANRGKARAKRQVKEDIEEFAEVVENATIEEVDTPSGRKEVEIAYEDGDGFHVEDGLAVGVYRDGDGYIKIDWDDERGRTVVDRTNVVTLEEGDWQ